MAFAIKDALQRLTLLHQAGNLAHAYLLHGEQGPQREILAKALAALLLRCRQEEDLQSHADFHLLQPTSKSRRILIEQVRLLEQFIQRRPSIGITKVAVIQDADRLAPNAANAFLKSLEEPPSGTYLILTASQPDALLPTVLSRCVQIPLRSERDRPANVHTEAVIHLFQQCIQSPSTPVVRAFQFSQAFQAILAQSKEKSALLEKFKSEREHYRNATDGKWLQEQEQYFKALAESDLLQLRRQLIAAIENYLALALYAPYRQDAVSSVLTTPLTEIPEKTILRQLECLERLHRVLDHGVHEGLALENCFLEVFSLLPAEN